MIKNIDTYERNRMIDILLDMTYVKVTKDKEQRWVKSLNKIINKIINEVDEYECSLDLDEDELLEFIKNMTIRICSKFKQIFCYKDIQMNIAVKSEGDRFGYRLHYDLETEDDLRDNEKMDYIYSNGYTLQYIVKIPFKIPIADVPKAWTILIKNWMISVDGRYLVFLIPLEPYSIITQFAEKNFKQVYLLYLLNKRWCLEKAINSKG